MEYRNKGLRARRILKMVDEWESGDRNNDVDNTDLLPLTDVFGFGDKPETDLNDVPTTSFADQRENERQSSSDLQRLQTVSELHRENSSENDLPSSSGRDYLDIVHEQAIRPPSSISNLSYILDNVDFIASPEGYIIRAIKSKSGTPTQFDSLIHDTVFESADRNIDKTLTPNKNSGDVSIESIFRSTEQNIFAETGKDVGNNSIIMDKTLTPQNRSILNLNNIITNRDEITEQQVPLENSNCETLQILDISSSQCVTAVSVSESLPNSFVETNADDDDYHSTSTKKLTRKRQRDEKEWIANKSKALKNSGQAYMGCHSKKRYLAKTVGPTCKCKLNCGETFSFDRRNTILQTFYNLGDHELQWQYITKYVVSESIKKLQINRNKNRTQTINYFLPLEGNNIRVCKVFFLSTLRISEQMVYTALEKNESDSNKTDNRGKHNNRPRKMPVLTEESIMYHIQLFPAKEAHYVRKSSKRKYLCETLNISNMYRLYTNWFKEEAEERYCGVQMATKRQYETIFNTKFNYSFFRPKKDLCGTCALYEQADDERKESLKDKYTKHINNKEKIRQIKNTEKENFVETSTLAIFDLEKVLGVPQSEVGIFHYKRKYPVYNFTVFDASRKKGYCYMWHSQIAKRGSIDIGSCLYNFIEEQHSNQINKISFYSDGCAGQNKNRFIFALYLFAATKFKLEITHRFFESGHSQNEGDSMHACIERAMKNKQIYTPDQLYGIVMNAKQTGEKYKVKEMRQSDFYDIKALITGQNWVNDIKGNKIYWSKIRVLKVTYTNPQSVYYKYDYDDEFTEMKTDRRKIRKRKSAANESLPIDDHMILKPAYDGPVPVSKALHDDLISLCRINAIPPNYHIFYNSLTSTSGIEAVQGDNDSESECNDED